MSETTETAPPPTVVVAVPPPPVIVTPAVLPVVASLCGISYTFALYYLVISAVMIIIPWTLPSIFNVSSAFVMDVLGILMFLAALAQIAYVSRVAATRRRCDCP